MMTSGGAPRSAASAPAARVARAAALPRCWSSAGRPSRPEVRTRNAPGRSSTAFRRADGYQPRPTASRRVSEKGRRTAGQHHAARSGGGGGPGGGGGIDCVAGAFSFGTSFGASLGFLSRALPVAGIVKNMLLAVSMCGCTAPMAGLHWCRLFGRSQKRSKTTN